MATQMMKIPKQAVLSSKRKKDSLMKKSLDDQIEMDIPPIGDFVEFTMWRKHTKYINKCRMRNYNVTYEPSGISFYMELDASEFECGFYKGFDISSICYDFPIITMVDKSSKIVTIENVSVSQEMEDVQAIGNFPIDKIPVGSRIVEISGRIAV